jgi:hypothetical protein
VRRAFGKNDCFSFSRPLNCLILNIASLFVIASTLGMLREKKLFTIQHAMFQIRAIAHECFALLDPSRRHVITSSVIVH